MSEIDEICKQINFLSQKLQEKIKAMEKKNTLIQNSNSQPESMPML